MTADEEKQAKDKKRHREELLALFLLLLTSTRDDLTRHTSAYLAGSLTLASLSDSLVQTLGAAHTQATTIGRQLAGAGGASVTEADEAFAASVMEEQETYLSGMLQAFAEGRYADGQAAGELTQRILLYCLRLRATALEAWLYSQPPSAMIEWSLHPAQHCPDCEEMAAGNPYSAAMLPTVPGAGDTRCLSQCACSLHLVGGGDVLPFVSI